MDQAFLFTLKIMKMKKYEKISDITAFLAGVFFLIFAVSFATGVMHIEPNNALAIISASSFILAIASISISVHYFCKH